MVCTFDPQKRFRKLLDFPCNTDWAETTSDWTDCRKRKIVSKKDKPPKCAAPRKTTKQRHQDMNKPRKPLYLKALESRSAGPGRVTKKPTINPLDTNREAVKCKVVSFHGMGAKFCVSGNMRVQSVPNVNDQWSVDDGALMTDRSNLSLGSTINLDSGLKHSRFQKEQIILQLHDRSASLIKYLFNSGNTSRSKDLRIEDISLPIRERRPVPQHEVQKKKHVILNPKDPEQLRFGEDYLGTLLPDSNRPLGYGLFGSPTSRIKLSRKTLEFPGLGDYSDTNFVLPPVNNSHPIRTSIDIKPDSYINSVSQLMGMLCIEPTNNNLPQHSIQQWLES